MILRKEREIAERWDGIAICSDDDKALLTAKFPDAAIWKVPNVVDKPLLPQRSGAGYNILFVGNLSFGPNSHGLATFLAQAWPTVRDALPGARLKVVGMNPSADLHAKLRAADAELHANVPSVTPYYADCDIVIAPIFFGSGTRIKILEAMAFGRPVLSTSLGAEGLGVQDGVHAAIADSMPDFATALIDLADNPEKRTALAEAGRCLQQEYFGPMSMIRAVNNMTDTCS
ncbi:glycosyltransferase family 4 protein [Sphingobium sp.]|uniref:glycosyltransferase family 4 protein n=1 Tax=Sphingobium sp. TaxID=1912891 RepID=UPI003B3A58E3